MVAERINTVSEEQDLRDTALLARIAAADRNALAELYAVHGSMLLRYLRHLCPDAGLAEELLQDTLLAVWHSASGFEGRSRVRTWLVGVARRQAHNTLRRRGLPYADEGTCEAVTVVAPDAASPEATVLAQTGHEELVTAINRLSLVQRETLALVIDGGLSMRETADALGIPLDTVKSRMRNARHALHTWLSAREEAER